MKRYASSGVLFALLRGWQTVDAGGKGSASKEALQPLQDLIGGWKGNGTREKNKSEIWKETAGWSWRFKDKDVWMTVEMSDSKFYKSGELRYLPEKKRYQLTLIDKKDKTLVFEGELKKGRLTVERIDPESKETQQLLIHTAAEGIRLIYTYSVKPADRTLFNKQFQIAYTKEGESFATAAKKVECVVTGGLG